MVYERATSGKLDSTMNRRMQRVFMPLALLQVLLADVVSNLRIWVLRRVACSFTGVGHVCWLGLLRRHNISIAVAPAPGHLAIHSTPHTGICSQIFALILIIMILAVDVFR